MAHRRRNYFLKIPVPLVEHFFAIITPLLSFYLLEGVSAWFGEAYLKMAEHWVSPFLMSGCQLAFFSAHI